MNIPVIPGIAIAALDAIQDQNAQTVLRSIVDGWAVRNGDAGNGKSRFITAGELGEINGHRLVGGLGTAIELQQESKRLGPGDISRLINDLQASVIESQLFKELGERIALIDDKYSLEVLGLTEELQAASDEILGLSNELLGLQDGSTDITIKTASGTTSIRALRDSVYDPATGLATATAAIGQINTLTLTSTSAAARQIASTVAQVNNPTTGLPAASAAIGQINTLTVTSTSAAARQIASMVAQVNDPATGLPAATAAIGQINTLTVTSGSAAARQIASTVAQVNDPISGLPKANANITAINDVKADSTSASARALHGVQATVNDPTTGLSITRAAVLALNDVSATSTSANARSLFAVTAQVGQKNKVFFQTTAPVTSTAYTLRVNDIWYDSDDKNRPYRWSGTAWEITSDGRIADVNTLVTNETITRANSDNAMAGAIQTVWAQLGDGSALVQQGANGYVNNAGAVATQWNQTQAALRDASGNLISSATVKQTADTAVNKAGDLEGKYTVKIDVNGYVSGFGLASTANNSTPFSEFIVRADRFAIGTPSVPDWAGYVNSYTDLLNAWNTAGQPDKEVFGYNHYYPAGQSEGRTVPNKLEEVIPFIVTTTPQTVNGKTAPPGVYIDSAFIKNGTITNANIGLAQVDTLVIQGNAVTVSSYDDNTLPTFTLTTTATELCSTTIVTGTLPSGALAGTIIVANATLYEGGGAAATIELQILIDGSVVAVSGCTLGESKTLTATAFSNFTQGTHIVSARLRVSTGSGGAATKSLAAVGGMIVMSGKR